MIFTVHAIVQPCDGDSAKSNATKSLPNARARWGVRLLSVILLALALCCPAFSFAQAVGGPLSIGRPAPEFRLIGTDGIAHASSDWKASSVFVVAFLCNHCAESQLYEARLNKLAQDYAKKGVSVVAIQSSNPNAFSDEDLAWSDVGETLADMKERATFRKFSFPYLYDGDTGATAVAFGATVAPSVYVFDKERKLRYFGRIDDNPADGPETRHEVVAAIDALLADKPVPVAKTTPTGCSLRLGADRDISKKEDVGAVAVSLAPAEVLTSLRHNPTGKLLLVNFYATWCGPCVTEFPDLMATNRMYRGRPFSFTTVSSNVPDEKAEVLAFLKKMNATTSNLLYGSDDTYAMQEAFDPNAGSAVPVTVLLSPRGDVLFHEQGEIDLMEIRRAILANLPDDPAHAGSQKYWATK
jgi:thiol-disulfide isomerase/thioredoxin